jgi:hypothetical protein
MRARRERGHCTSPPDRHQKLSQTAGVSRIRWGALPEGLPALCSKSRSVANVIRQPSRKTTIPNTPAARPDFLTMPAMQSTRPASPKAP